MCRVRFSLPVVLALFVGTLLAGQQTEFEISELSAKGRAAYDLLLGEGTFSIGPVGFAALIPPRQIALYDLLQEKEAVRACKSLLRRASPGGQLYELLGLYLRDCPTYKEVVKLYLAAHQAGSGVAYPSGCIIRVEKIQTIVDQVENGQFYWTWKSDEEVMALGLPRREGECSQRVLPEVDEEWMLSFMLPEVRLVKPKPVVILIEHNPLLKVIGLDSPSFALYKNGQVIFRAPQGEYLGARLNEKEQAEFIASLWIGEDFYELSDHCDYEVSEASDQPTNILYVLVKHRQNSDKSCAPQVKDKRVVVYGRIRDDPEARAKVPRAFLEVFDKLVSYQNIRATPWTPERIEVLIWPFDHSHGKRLPWPKS